MNLIKRSIAVGLLFLLAFSSSVFAEDTQTKAINQNNGGISIQTVDRSGTIALGQGEYFSVDFKMNKLFGTDHNKFVVKVSNITQGSVKVEITGSDGYSWTSSAISSDTTITTTNAKVDVTYTVTFTGNNTYGALGKYSIISSVE